MRRGHIVKEGDVIAVLSDEAREARVLQAQAMLMQRKTELAANMKLVEQGTMPKLEAVNLETQFKAAEAGLAAAEAEKRARRRFARHGRASSTTCRSRSGRRCSRCMGKEIAQIVSIDPILAVVEVAERNLAGVHARRSRRDPPRHRHEGERQDPLHLQDGERRYPHLPGRRGESRTPTASIPDGITAEVAIPLAPVPATRVPRSALTFSSSGELGVRIVDAASKVAFVPVSVIEDQQEFMWVGGVADGARVIVQGQDFVREGQEVEPVEARGAEDRRALSNTEAAMANPVDYAINHARLTIAALAFLLIAGLVAYLTIPKEAEPDVKIPIIYTLLSQRGISPEDAERLLIKPVETKLKSVSNVKEMRATAFEGGAYVLLEFQAGFDSKSALADVRAKVDEAKRDLPSDADEPTVQEVNLSLYPVLVVALAGDLPERSLARHRAHRQEHDRTGARRHFGRDSRRARRGGRDRRRADADEELRRLARATHRDHPAVEQPRGGRRARRRDRPLCREGAGADRKAAGHAEDSGRGERRRGRDARRRRAGEADLQGRDLDHPRQRPSGDDHRSLEAHRREPDRDRRRREIRRRSR